MSTNQLNLLSAQDVETFQREGVVCLRQVFDHRWLDLVAGGILRNLAEPSAYAQNLKTDGDTGRFFGDYCNWRRIPEFRAFVYDSPAAPIAAQLMPSEKVIFYHEHLLIKEPGTQKPTPWHHDQPYYPIEGLQVCSIWMPLDPVARATCVQFVKGSHTWGRWFVPRNFNDGRDYPCKGQRDHSWKGAPFQTVPDIDGHRERYEIVCWDLNPGDCIVFHMLILHGAPGNTSLTTSRRVLATRWVGDDARFTERPWEISPPMTGGLQPGEPMACDEFPVVWPRT